MDSIVPDSYPNTNDWRANESIALKAVPAPGYEFVNWSGSVSGSDESISVEMTCNKSVTANFAVISYTLVADAGPGAGGEVIVEPSQSGGGYAAGSEVTVTAVPGNGYAFSHWSGAISGSKNPVNVIMDSNKELTANFTEATTFVWVWVASGVIAIGLLAYFLRMRRQRTT